MDPVTVLSLVGTVTGVAFSVISNTYNIVQAAKAIQNAPKQAQELHKQISSVSNLLPSLAEESQFTSTPSLIDDLLDFKSMLNEKKT